MKALPLIIVLVVVTLAFPPLGVTAGLILLYVGALA